MTTRIDRDQVLSALRTTGVLLHFTVAGKRHGDELRLKACPKCGDAGREHAAINLATGAWKSHRCGCHGDLLGLIAALAGLDVRADFPRVLELAATIAGVQPGEPDAVIAQRRAAREREQREREAAEQAERDAARDRMPAVWGALDRHDERGAAYLRSRGIDPRRLELMDVVRYRAGDPAVALRDLATGEVVGVQCRCVVGRLKLVCEPGSQVAGAALHGRIAEIDPDGIDIAILVEGLADTLAAFLAWPTCAIFGAPGADQMPAIASAVATRIAAVRGRLWIAVDDDLSKGHDRGVEAAARAINAARAAGLELGRDLHIIEIGEHHDVADAWRAGWRPLAP